MKEKKRNENVERELFYGVPDQREDAAATELLRKFMDTHKLPLN